MDDLLIKWLPKLPGNEFKIVAYIHVHGFVNKTQLAKTTGMSLFTVKKAIPRLVGKKALLPTQSGGFITIGGGLDARIYVQEFH